MSPAEAERLEAERAAKAGKFLTVKQAAALLQVHEETVRRWIRSNRVPYHKFGPDALVRLKLEDLRHVAAEVAQKKAEQEEFDGLDGEA